MDRFFSKLDLRDIKIKPEGTRFLPTEDEGDLEDQESIPEPTGSYVAASPIATPNNYENPFDSARYAPSPEVETEYELEPAPELQNGAVEHAVPVEVKPEVHYDNGEVLKVSAKSRPSAVAGAIAGVVRDAGRAEVQAIGAGATNQAVKAVAIARDYLLESGIDAVCVPAFIDVIIDDEERTAIRLVVETR